MRAIPESMDATTVAAIDRRLDGIEASEGVTIPWGIESGSRAWGFPSPDSDYDCRFLYVRSLGDYLSPWQRRDVIDTPLDKVFDVNGWDLAKALRLLVKGNGTLTEWLRSPIVYRGDPVFRDEFLALAEQVTDRALLGRHYRHVGLQHFATERLSLKRFFYALRPAAVLHWLDAHPDRAVPPMELMAALEDGDAPAEVRAASADLVALKAGDARVRRRQGAGCAGAVRGCRADPRGALRIRGAPRLRGGAGAVRGVLRTGGGPLAEGCAHDHAPHSSQTPVTRCAVRADTATAPARPPCKGARR